MIEVATLPVGPLHANCHIVSNTETHEAVIVDPGDDPERIARFIDSAGLKPVAIWNTHAHIDHVNANAPLKDRYKAPITIHELEKDWLASDLHTLARFCGVTLRISQADHTWIGGERFEALGTDWKVYHTPGHSPGGVSIISPTEGIMLSGDLLFEGSIGRTDLPGGDHEVMADSIRSCMREWAMDNWRVYSGHGPMTTIGEERLTNPYVLEFLATP